METMNTDRLSGFIKFLAVVAIIGAVNWGLIGFFNWNLVDAIFGAAAMGDIGRHFPNTEARWKDAAGLDLLARGIAIVGEHGWRPASADVTVVLERPKLVPHIDEIRRRLAEVLGVAVTAVSVKGKTNEGVDAVGRGEAIAAHAVAVLIGADA